MLTVFGVICRIRVLIVYSGEDIFRNRCLVRLSFLTHVVLRVDSQVNTHSLVSVLWGGLVAIFDHLNRVAETTHTI